MRTRASTLVGRDSEADRLAGLLDEARSGRGGAAFVVGEPGIGKSRLAAEAVRRAQDAGMVVLRGRASATGPTVPFRPLTEALLSLVRRGVPLPADALGPYRPILGRLVPEWSTGESGPSPDSLIMLGEAILRLTAAVADGHGCVLFLDDLHDADVESLAVVEYICDNLHTQSTALIATARSEPGPAFDLVRSVSRRESGTTVELGRLGIADAPAFIASCLGEPDVPAGLPERLWRDSAGVPFVVEELLHGMVDAGTLVRGEDGWRLRDTDATSVPPTVARAIVDRAERLGPKGWLLCSAAAVVGRRFSLTVVQRVTGIDDRSLLEHLHAGVEAQLIARDDHGLDWYTFQHPLTAEALRSRLTPVESADLSRRAADAVAELHPGLPGEWCQLAALLRVGAEQPVEAAALFAEAGGRALADGAAGSAVALLQRAERLLADAGEPGKRADVLEQLLYALAEHGQFDRAFALADALAGLPPERRVALHVRLAWAGHIAGRWDEGMAQVAAARALLPEDADVAATAPVDVIAAYLAMDGPGEDRHAHAEALARPVIAAADRVTPTALCQAWQVVGIVARDRDLAEARACFDRVREVAKAGNLPIWEVYGVIGEASIAWLVDSDVTVVEKARDAALRVGAITLAENMAASIAMDSVLRAEFALASAQIEAALTAVRRLRLVAVERFLYVVCAALAAHQGKRADMERALAAFRAAGDEAAQERPLAHGLAGAICALLEEDGAAARRELAVAAEVEARSPTTFHLSGTNGLRVLLSAVDGEVGVGDVVALGGRPSAAMRWNRQFVLFAEAVALGRAGDPAAAGAKAAAARAAGEPFPMARNLALRLVAESARRDGWGEPVAWLREAEEHFHGAGVAPVASACRALLRSVGESVRQRRTGTDRVPARLRALGVTIREYEVFELLPERLGNKGLAGRLHISPRTVEKHVASLIAKTGCPDRAALVDFARRFRD
ncbi:helix-turn-helix transcriptional regulator [Actinokineospora sp. UTMC 2448]|uniref:helix-turn-helix transcriptional regulator n=1 Tax=Actinokineospora sp. UTMC 2448 TaxID=2268449 RepID=UPI002164EE63|nr:AAA family ATPase [Actinokineospora sp. UTMC 2448]UVS81567.1 transcriptional regulator MalT [Actinokineospora sp. UTMC 2448]